MKKEYGLSLSATQASEAVWSVVLDGGYELLFLLVRPRFVGMVVCVLSCLEV